MKTLYTVWAVSAIIGTGAFFGIQYLYDNRTNKCVVSFADAISSRPEIVELSKRCKHLANTGE